MNDSPVKIAASRQASPLRTGARRFLLHAAAGLFASGLLHAALSIACVLALLGLFDLLFPPPPQPTPVVIVASVEPRDEPVDVTMTAYDDRTAEEHLADDAASRGDWLGELLAEGQEPSDDEPTQPTVAVAAELVEQASERSRERSAEENLDQLDELGQRLTDVSSERAVGDIGDVLSKALNLEERATAPVEAPATQAEPRRFENASAQLHDVRLERDEATGSERYVATLVDRHGTAIDMEMDPESGKQAYDAMQTIKKYPLLESVYRTLVMKILDRLIAPAPGA